MCCVRVCVCVCVCRVRLCSVRVCCVRECCVRVCVCLCVRQDTSYASLRYNCTLSAGVPQCNVVIGVEATTMK